MEILNIIKESFLGNIGEILFGLVTAFFAFLGTVVKNMADEYIKDKEKREIVKTVVKAVEQMHHGLKGSDKLRKAMESASEMLLEKGIRITELELLMLIEAAVCEFNDAFNKEEWKNSLDEATSSDEPVLGGDTYTETETEPDEEVTAETYG